MNEHPEELDEAIAHALTMANKHKGTDCGAEHDQLAVWLQELRSRRELTCGYNGVQLILAERVNQQVKWSAEHDDAEHGDQSLLTAALVIAQTCTLPSPSRQIIGPAWAHNLAEKYAELPFFEAYIKLLSIAGALIAAEMDRILRREVKLKPKRKTVYIDELEAEMNKKVDDA